jgi:hypothetical protein
MRRNRLHPSRRRPLGHPVPRNSLARPANGLRGLVCANRSGSLTLPRLGYVPIQRKGRPSCSPISPAGWVSKAQTDETNIYLATEGLSDDDFDFDFPDNSPSRQAAEATEGIEFDVDDEELLNDISPHRPVRSQRDAPQSSAFSSQTIAPSLPVQQLLAPRFRKSRDPLRQINANTGSGSASSHVSASGSVRKSSGGKENSKRRTPPRR